MLHRAARPVPRLGQGELSDLRSDLFVNPVPFMPEDPTEKWEGGSAGPGSGRLIGMNNTRSGSC